MKMNNDKDLKKKIVKEKYGKIASQDKIDNQNSCCGTSSCCSYSDYTIFSENYTKIKGYYPDADLGLGCGIPVEFANIKEGDTVIDLGSGVGNDCFIARSLVGESGTVIGIDFTEEMIEKANENLKKLGYKNVLFLKGDIENIPVSENKADVVISNCVLNLVPDKIKVFSEIYRILKIDGHFSISDIVLNGELPTHQKKSILLYTGCISGDIQKNE